MHHSIPLIPEEKLTTTAAGRVPVSIDELRLKLGRPAFHVWQILTTRRAKDGTTHVTINGIANAKGYVRMGYYNVRFALARLKASGLVRDIGWIWKDVPSGKRMVNLEVYMRRVYGQKGISYKVGECVTVPGATWKWLQTASGHGGARKGSGRKPKLRDPKLPVIEIVGDYPSGAWEHREIKGAKWARIKGKRTIIRPEDVDDLVCDGVIEAPVDWIDPTKSGVIKTVGGVIKTVGGSEQPRLATDIYKTTSRVDSEEFSFLKKRSDAEASPSPLLSLKMPASKPPILRHVKDRKAPATEKRLGEEETGLTIAGTGTPSPRLRIDIPPPSWTSAPAAIVPPPPLLDPTAPPREWAAKIVRAYRDVVAHRTGKPCWIMSKGDITKSKYYKRIVETADALIKHQLSPIQWVWFCCVSWEEGGGKKSKRKSPPVTTVFSASRVNDARGWCRSMTSNQFGGRVIFSEAHKDLMQRYAEMRRDLHKALSDPKIAMQEHFPDGLYDKLIALAKKQGAAIQRRLNAKAQAGKWVW